jgi:hypothetical protein
MEALQAKIEELQQNGLKYEAEFVPQRFSRNAGNKYKSINWRITISKDGKFLTTDYMQGIGHAPFYNENNSLKQREMAGQASEKGLGLQKKKSSFYVKLLKPSLTDVLYSLVMDSDVFNYDDFEDWAECFGYDSDSISHKEIYEACLHIGKQFKKLVNINELVELYQDY